MNPTRKRTATLALVLVLAAVEAAAQTPVQTGPRLDLSVLTEHDPGWIPVESTGDTTEGATAVELAVWPLMFLHWYPAPDAKALKQDQAADVLAKLWEELTIDTPLDLEPVTINGHEGFVADTTIQRGEYKTRYHVWLCPESRRIIAADASLNLMVNAPAEIFGWMNDIVRTVRCHTGAPVQSFPHLPRSYEVPSGEIAYSYPEAWRPLEGFRVVKRWDDWNQSVANSEAVTPQRGRDVVMKMDPLKRIELRWGPAVDEPLTWDLVNERVQEYWRQRAGDMIPQERGARGDVWYSDGLVRTRAVDQTVPPHRMHKFRIWIFRRGETDFLVMARMAGVALARRRPGFEFEEVNLMLDEMLQAVRY